MRDLLTTPPEYEGPRGRMWIPSRGEGAGLGMIVVDAPDYHPVWHSYAISLLHLREVEGFKAPVLYDHRATHEVMVAALDPAYLVLARKEEGSLNILYPPNFIGQFSADSDEAAFLTVRAAAVDVCDGLLSPDTDHRPSWVRRFPYVKRRTA